MRALTTLVIAALSSAAACAPVFDPNGCPEPCPLACPNSCLPSGYCAGGTWQPATDPPVTRAEGRYLDIAFGDLPPGAPVSLSFHGVLDLVARGDSVPWDYTIDIQLADPADGGVHHVLTASAFNAIDFPVVGDWSLQTLANDAGVLELPFWIGVCEDRHGRQANDCLEFLPATKVGVALIDPTPWEAAPACP